VQLDKKFWQGKKVLVTGHTGFKGGWLCVLLRRLGADVYGYSLAPEKELCLYNNAQISSQLSGECIGDIREINSLRDFFGKNKPEVLFHLAAQPLVSESYETPIDTYTTNVIGLANVLEVCRNTPSLKSILVVTSDKCYLNEGSVWQFREHDPLGGNDPYSASKACAEIVARSYYHSFLGPQRIPLHTLRAGNIIGGGDWAENRLIPDVVRSVFEDSELTIRMPQATRPWQHVLDALKGYLLVAQYATLERVPFETWNFGPDAGGVMSVAEILKTANMVFPQLKWAVQEKNSFKEAHSLSLDSSKARKILGWSPAFETREAIRRSFSWYSLYYQVQNALELCQAEIDETFQLSEP
jgi:CDP-glucose 4,6-dehydratase